MNHYIRRPLLVTAFAWDRKLSTIKKNVPKQDLGTYVKCFNTFNGMEAEIYTCDKQTWESPTLGSVIIHSKFGYSICSQKWFLRLYRKQK